MTIQFVGLDGEMSGTSLSEGHKLIQIGIAFDGEEPGRRLFTSDIGWKCGDYKWTQEALDVNGFTLSKIERGPSCFYVDDVLEKWLKEREATRGSLIPVGWNVGSFDIPFVRDCLPKSSFYFSRRTVDLNAACFTLGGTIDLGGINPSWKGWKRLSKESAERILKEVGFNPQWHDAGYDALAALKSWEFFREILSKSTEDLSPASKYALRKMFQREEVA